MSAEVERLRFRSAAVDRLEQENRVLQDELDVLRNRNKLQRPVSRNGETFQVSAQGGAVTGLRGGRSPVRQPLGEISTNATIRPMNAQPKRTATVDAGASAELAELQLQHAKLSAAHNKLKYGYNEIRARGHELLTQRDDWVKYAKSLESKLSKLQRRLGRELTLQTSSMTDSPPYPGAERPDAGKVPANDTPFVAPRPTAHLDTFLQNGASVSFSGVESVPTDLPPRRAASSPAESQHTKNPGSMTNNTQDDSEETSGGSPQLPRLPMNGVATPDIVIKEEPSSDGPVIVSERRISKRKHQVDSHNDSTARTPQRVKTEHGSSDPVVTGESNYFSPHESIDLDREDLMPTPKKNRFLQPEDQHPADNQGAGKVGQLIRSSAIKGSLARPSTTGVGSALRPPASELSALVSPARRSVHKAYGNDSARGPGDPSLADRIASLTEDGEHSTDPDEPAPSESVPKPVTAWGSRLDSLLNPTTPPPQGGGLLLRPNRQSRETSRFSHWVGDTPVRVLPFGKGDAKSKDPTPKAIPKATGNLKAAPRRHATEAGTPGISKANPEAMPLRKLPLAQLRLEDFKINPKFNNGRDFAFSEVVRNKSERADLPGCTDPECCGKHFRAMAQAELEAAGPSLIHRTADITLLEDFLGDQVYKLGSMTRQEKEQLWLEAKTRELANKHGKHRHRFSRRQSPPGFWNADFPTTQENKMDREEGQKREKRLVEERWREAMRDGGKWLFKDE